MCFLGEGAEGSDPKIHREVSLEGLEERAWPVLMVVSLAEARLAKGAWSDHWGYGFCLVFLPLH